MLILGTCSDGPYFLDGTILRSHSTLPVHVTFGLFTVHLYTFFQTDMPRPVIVATSSNRWLAPSLKFSQKWSFEFR